MAQEKLAQDLLVALVDTFVFIYIYYIYFDWNIQIDLWSTKEL